MRTLSVTITTTDDVRLEGRLAMPDGEPRGGVVICHPHPQFGGTMSSSLVPVIQRAVVARGWAALRFNFRGAGRSEGRYERGTGELKDAAAAVELLAQEIGDLPLAIAGWSFGSLVALAVAVSDPRIRAYAGIAPPVVMRHSVDLPPLPPPERLAAWTGRAVGICGTTDPYCTPKALEEWLGHIPGAQMQIFDGEDHFFSTSKGELAETVADFLVA